MRLNKTLIKSLVVVLVVFCWISGCSRAPDPQEDIALFEDFIAENIDKVSDDPYISSTVKPGDKMYDFLVELQHGLVHKETYEPLIENSDSVSKLWYARLSMFETPRLGQVYQWIKESVDEGNPYAALELSEKGDFCQFYGKGSASSELFHMAGINTSYESDLCSKEYLDQAIEGFEVLAKQGDLRAQYFLLKQKGWDKSQDTRADYIHEVIRFAEQHYYQPLMDYVATIFYRPKGKRIYTANTQEQHDLAIQLLTIASNYNYIPAINWLNYVIENDDVKKMLVDRAMSLGDAQMLTSQYYKMEDDSSEQYYYNAIIKDLTGKYVHPPTESDEYPEVKKQAEDFVKSIHSSVYIDGFTDRAYWHPF